MESRKRKWIRALRAITVIAFGAKCVKCGSTDETTLQFAHIKPTKLKGMGRGSYERIRDVIKNPDCYCLLCEECHMEFDDGKIEVIVNGQSYKQSK